jgi:MinD superfamily P-loop ATPase
MADCDVDAADLHLVLAPEKVSQEDFYSGVKADISSELCTNCGICASICRFDAIYPGETSHTIDPLKCEGCGYCSYVCPAQAITLREERVGEFYLSRIKTGSMMAHARLGIGADNSGKLVAKVKKEAKLAAEKNGNTHVLVDGSPGIGCPVISSLSGANLVLFITEPSQSGMHDLKRVWELTKKFKIPAACIINKCDLNSNLASEIKVFLEQEGIVYLDSFGYDTDFQKAITQGISVVEYNPQKWSQRFTDIWNKLQTKESL